MDIKAGYFVGASAYQSVTLGFVPDHLDIHTLGSNLVSISWDGGVNILVGQSLTNPAFGFAQFGCSVNQEDGQSYMAAYSDTSNCYEIPCGGANWGISAMDRAGEYAMIPHPDGTGDKPKVVTAWAANSVLTGTDRADGVIGMLNRPTESNMKPSLRGFVYEAVAIDAAASACGATEPVWPVIPGKSVVDNDIDWLCRTEKVVRAGGKGFILGGSVLTDGDLVVFTAYRADTNKYLGNAFDTGEVYLNATWNKV